MDYYKKYLKYKKKYLDLVKEKKIKELKKLIGGGNILTLKNGGRRENYENSCMWISIHDYLKKVLNIDITLEELRNQGDANQPRDKKELFDSSIIRYVEGINKISEIYNLVIKVYSRDPENPDNLILSDVYPFIEFGKINNGNKNIVNIISFGYHFELLIQSRQLNYDITKYFNIQPKAQAIKQEQEIELNIPHIVFDSETNTYIDIEQKEKEIEEIHEQIKNIDNEIIKSQRKFEICFKNQNIKEMDKHIDIISINESIKKVLLDDYYKAILIFEKAKKIIESSMKKGKSSNIQYKQEMKNKIKKEIAEIKNTLDMLKKEKSINPAMNQQALDQITLLETQYKSIDDM